MRAVASLLALTLLLALPSAAADVTLAGALAARPAGAGTLEADFVFAVARQQAGRPASLRLAFGDGVTCELGPVGAATPPGTYASGCPGTASYEVAQDDDLLRVTFRHRYPEAREYHATWFYPSEETPSFPVSRLEREWDDAADLLGEHTGVGWHYGATYVLAL